MSDGATVRRPRGQQERLSSPVSRNGSKIEWCMKRKVLEAIKLRRRIVLSRASHSSLTKITVAGRARGTVHAPGRYRQSIVSFLCISRHRTRLEVNTEPKALPLRFMTPTILHVFDQSLAWVPRRTDQLSCSFSLLTGRRGDGRRVALDQWLTSLHCLCPESVAVVLPSTRFLLSTLHRYSFEFLSVLVFCVVS